MGRNSSAIQNLGSGKAVYWEVTAAGVKDGAVTQFGYIKDSELVDEVPTKDTVAEGGETFTTDDPRKVTYKITLLQRETTDLKWATHTMAGKRIAILKELNAQSVNGKYQYCYMGICKVVKKGGHAFPGGEPVYEFNLESNDAALGLVLSETCITGQGFEATMTGTLTIGAGDIYNYVELT